MHAWHCLFLKLTKSVTSNPCKAKSDARDARTGCGNARARSQQSTQRAPRPAPHCRNPPPRTKT
ncbi:hypothetical protein CF640_36345, partial [Burkholderia pseudomallei]